MIDFYDNCITEIVAIAADGRVLHSKYAPPTPKTNSPVLFMSGVVDGTVNSYEYMFPDSFQLPETAV